MLVHVDYFFEISFGIFGILINAIFERIIEEIYVIFIMNVFIFEI